MAGHVEDFSILGLPFSHVHQAQWKEEQERVTRITLSFKNK